MEFALGVLHWSPSEFWNSTPLELTSAYVGHMRYEGRGRWAPDPSGFNFETAAAAQRALDASKRKTGGRAKMKGVTKADRDAYKASRRELKEQGKLGGYTH